MWYVYGWYEILHDGNKVPFYIGIGKINKKSKYSRAFAVHQYSNRRLTTAQLHLNELKLESDCRYSIDILMEELTLDDARGIEFSLVNYYGRRCNRSGILYNIVEGGGANPMHDPEVKVRWDSIIKSDSHREVQRIKYSNAIARDPTIITRRRDSLIARHQDEEFKNNYIASKNSKEYKKLQQECHVGVSVNVEGVSYPSIREASRVTGIDRKTISKKIRLGRDVSVNYRKSCSVEYKGIKYESIRSLSRETHISRTVINKLILDGSIVRI